MNFEQMVIIIKGVCRKANAFLLGLKGKYFGRYLTAMGRLWYNTGTTRGVTIRFAM